MIIKASSEHIDILTNVVADVLADLPNYAGVEFDREHTRRMLGIYLDLPGLGCFFEAVDGEVVGLFMGMIHPQWFTPTLEMSELMFWVRADYRATPLARQLMCAMEAWAVPGGARKLLVAAASGYETARVERFYNRMGYRTCALITCKEV